MKRLFTLFTLLFILTIQLSFAQAPIKLDFLEPKHKAVTNSTTDDVYYNILNRYAVQIVSINPALGICSGTVIGGSDKYTYVLTCKHCINLMEEMYVENLPVKTILTSVGEDLAIIMVEGKLKNKTPVTKVSSVKVGETIYFRGKYSLNPNNELTNKGAVIRFSKDWGFAALEARNGCSGSGLFNTKCELVGVLWGGTTDVTLFEPMEDVFNFVQSFGLL